MLFSFGERTVCLLVRGIDDDDCFDSTYILLQPFPSSTPPTHSLLRKRRGKGSSAHSVCSFDRFFTLAETERMNMEFGVLELRRAFCRG